MKRNRIAVPLRVLLVAFALLGSACGSPPPAQTTPAVAQGTHSTAAITAAPTPEPGPGPGPGDAQRDLHLQGAVNARDLGGLKGQKSTVPTNRFIRTADLSKATEQDKAALLEHSVKLDLDLRTPEEIQKAPDALANDPRFKYVNISLLGDAPLDLPSIKSLGDLYIRALAENQTQFKRVFHELASQQEGAVLYHCTAGKDRTGMISAMLLSLAGVERQTIIQNYALSAYYLKAGTEALLKKDPSLAVVLGTPPAEMGRFLDALDSQYGGVRGYLKQIGVSDADVQVLSTRLGQ